MIRDTCMPAIRGPRTDEGLRRRQENAMYLALESKGKQKILIEGRGNSSLDKQSKFTWTERKARVETSAAPGPEVARSRVAQ